MRNRLWILVSLLLVATLVFAACGAPPAAPAEPAESAAEAEAESEAEAEPTEEPAEEAAEESAAEESAEESAAEESADGPSLTIWADDTRAPILETLAADFEAAYGIPIVVTEKGFGAIRDDFKVAAPTGEGPDIIIGAHDWIGELTENGLLAEISLGDMEEQFLGAAVDGFRYDGTLYGMPYATENVALVYNPDIVAEVPATWSDVQALAAELEGDGTVPQLYIRQEGDPYHFFPIQTAFGGYVFGLTDAGYDPSDVGIDSEGSIAAATWLDGMVKDGHLNKDAAVDYDIMHAAFEKGDAAMIVTGPWALPRIRESGIPYAVTTIPGEVQDAQPFIGVQGFMISSFSDDPLLAQTFLQEFVANQETMQAIFDADPRPSAYVPVREAIEDADIAAFATAGDNGLAMPAIPEMSGVWDSWGNAVTLVTQQREAPDAAFTNAADQIRENIQ